MKLLIKKNIHTVVATSNEFLDTVKNLNLNCEILGVNTNNMNETINHVLKKYNKYEYIVLTMPDTYKI